MMELEHELKCAAPYFDAIARREMNFEVLRDDRGFQKGDILVLRRLCHDTGFCHILDHDAPPIRRRVTFILTGGQLGIEPGHIVMALEAA